MGIATKIAADAFDGFQMDAGVLLKNFNPTSPTIADADIICATTGGISVSCVPTYSDWGEDVDNCPNNTAELKHLDGWDCTMSTSCLGATVDIIKLSLGAADVASTKITPRASVDIGDFTEAIWWVGDRVDGGFVAVKMINALSTGGFSLQTAKNGKGTIALEITGHVSIEDITVVPMEFYSIDPTP